MLLGVRTVVTLGYGWVNQKRGAAGGVWGADEGLGTGCKDVFHWGKHTRWAFLYVCDTLINRFSKEARLTAHY